jgi:16S rRNA (guanine(966)-N(2))-methyltransferase RsmD
MRIIGGVAKGRHIYLPKGNQIRPTPDGIKESLFNILHSLEGITFIDLFAGSGNVGLEALSRGASRVVFVEKSTVMITVIKRNLRELGFDNKYEIIAAEVAKCMRKLNKRKEYFDILFADPPYEKGFVSEIFQCLGEVEIISRDGVIIIQHSLREDVDEQHTANFTLTEQRRYGDTLLSFLKKDMA